MYEYKTIPVSKMLTTKEGRNLGEELAIYIENIINTEAKKGWEFYRADNYCISETLGCLSSIIGKTGNLENYNLLVFKKEITN